MASKVLGAGQLFIGIKMGKVSIWPSSSISVKMALYGLRSVGSRPVINWDQISKSFHLAIFKHLGKNGIIWPQKCWERVIYWDQNGKSVHLAVFKHLAISTIVGARSYQ